MPRLPKKIMKKTNIIATAVVAGSVLTLGSQLMAQEEGELLFQDPLNADTSANWTINNNAPETVPADDWVATFAWDYTTTHGIPPAPNAESGGETKALRLQVNRFGGNAYAISLSPNGQTFSGNYVMKFDLWMNFNGPLGPDMPAGGSGSTEYATFGVGTDGNSVHRWIPLATPEGPGGWFAIDGEGGSGLDFRAMANGTSIPAAEGSPYLALLDPEFDPAFDARRWSQTYYHEALPGGATSPIEQIEAPNYYYTNYGETAPGVAGFMWHEMRIEVVGESVTWYVNDLPIAELTPETASQDFPTEGNIFIGYIDSYTSLADFDSDLSFALFSNLRVHSLPSDSGFAAWAEENITDDTLRGPEDNPSGDGISNLLKYALGLDPEVADPSALPQGTIEADGGESYLTLSASRNPDATDVSLNVEVSDDLVTWESGTGHTAIIVDDANTLQVRDETAFSATDRRFIRLSASLIE